MQGAVVLLTVINSLQQGFIFKEVTILDFLGDTGQLLIYDTAGTHIHMTYLGVTHLALGKSYCHTAGIAVYKRILLHQGIHYRGIGLCYGIALYLIIQSITIQDH